MKPIYKTILTLVLIALSTYVILITIDYNYDSTELVEDDMDWIDEMYPECAHYKDRNIEQYSCIMNLDLEDNDDCNDYEDCHSREICVMRNSIHSKLREKMNI